MNSRCTSQQPGGGGSSKLSQGFNASITVSFFVAESPQPQYSFPSDFKWGLFFFFLKPDFCGHNRQFLRHIKEYDRGSSRCSTAEINLSSNHKVEGSISGLAQLRIRCCHELWCRLQIQLGSCVAVAQAGSCSSNSTLCLGASICHMCGPKEQKNIYIYKLLYIQ